jgi:pimeloyl-ACP methyl ester carboxylesterase
MTLFHWNSGGAETPLVFLHGLLRDRTCFAPLFPAVTPHFNVHSVDEAGHGQSPRLERYRLIDQLPGLVEFLRTVEEPAILYGHSMGAMLAAAVAAAHPELVHAVVLEDPPFHTMGRRLAGTELEAYFRAIQPYIGARVSWRELSQVKIGGQTLGAIREPAQIRFMAACIMAVDPRVLEPVLSGEWLDGYDPESILSSLRCPALLFQSDPAAGGMLTGEDAAAATRLAADLTLVRLPGIGHQAHWQDAPAISRHLLAFLLSLD